ncbi:MAG TPA: helix-turn-helix domain-containing protein, partial [Candidatus Dormibacteraeota bacterium]|nr:helix-turn-helix domain-containing protein [Candidatus Dormibacteraeota bacterium]
ELIEAEARKRAEAAYIAQTAPVCPIADIVAACSEITGISIDDMRGPRRSRHLAWPRHFTIWMIRRLRWDMSMPMIAKLMGNRDHTTVLHAVRNVEKRRGEIDAPFAGWIEDPRAQALLSRKAAQ